MNAKILDLIERDGLVLGCRSTWWGVVLRICAESTNIHLASGNGTVGINLDTIRLWIGAGVIQHIPQQQQTGLETFGSSSGCLRRYQIANSHIQDGSDTTQSRSRLDQPSDGSDTATDCNVEEHTRSLSVRYWTMYSFASFAALTRVSVP